MVHARPLLLVLELDTLQNNGPIEQSAGTNTERADNSKEYRMFSTNKVTMCTVHSSAHATVDSTACTTAAHVHVQAECTELAAWKLTIHT
jgi:hypothetical protein